MYSLQRPKRSRETNLYYVYIHYDDKMVTIFVYSLGNYIRIYTLYSIFYTLFMPNTMLIKIETRIEHIIIIKNI